MINFRYLKRKAYLFIRENLLLIFFILVIFILGVIFASIAVRVLSYQQKKELVDYLGQFVGEVDKLLRVEQRLLARDIIFLNLKTLFFFWILSLTIVGVLAVPIILFLRVFILAFTIAFLLDEFFLRGVLLIFIVIFPQNIIIIPSLILAAVLSLSFVFKIGKLFLFNGHYSYKKIFINYSFSILVIAIFLVIAGLIEVYLLPFLIRILGNYLI